VRDWVLVGQSRSVGGIRVGQRRAQGACQTVCGVLIDLALGRRWL